MNTELILNDENNLMIAYKRRDLSFFDCNAKFLNYAGIKDKTSVIGRNDYDLAWSKYANSYREHDEDALRGKIYTRLVPLENCKGETLLFINVKKPLLNKRGIAVGVISYAAEVKDEQWVKFFNLLAQADEDSKRNLATFDKQPICLSKRENECLLLLAKGRTAKAIAIQMGISFRTIEGYIERLKLKFNCSSKSALIDAAIHHGYIEIIPGTYSLIK